MSNNILDTLQMKMQVDSKLLAIVKIFLDLYGVDFISSLFINKLCFEAMFYIFDTIITSQD